ncbi:hypothetical protein D1007_15237 [Hordeum vulgare]|nr:hypothetical protein D1007_15237 [Hordeum vulgare]
MPAPCRSGWWCGLEAHSDSLPSIPVDAANLAACVANGGGFGRGCFGRSRACHVLAALVSSGAHLPRAAGGGGSGMSTKITTGFTEEDLKNSKYLKYLTKKYLKKHNARDLPRDIQA